MEEDDPASVDARSIYIGNVSWSEDPAWIDWTKREIRSAVRRERERCGRWMWMDG